VGLFLVSLVPWAAKDVVADGSTSEGSSRPQVLFVKNMQGKKAMENKNLYETIFKRKSIRQYDPTPLDGDILTEIMAHTGALKPLYDGINVEIKLLSQKDVKSLFQAKAPHYLAVFSEAKDGYLANAGFMLQQMDLFFSANGIGSCWQGIPKPTKEILNRSKFEFIILLAFGRPRERLHRESVSDFKRKPFGGITNLKVADSFMEPAQLAPSAMNRQPWFFTGSARSIHVHRVKSSFLTAFVLDKTDKISIGIAICHIWLAVKHFGKEVEFISDREAQNNAPEGHDYVITIKIK
jgi:nitroreductase